MSYVRSGPSLGAVVVSVWLAGGVTSFASAVATAALVLRDASNRVSATELVGSLAGGLVIGTALGAALVYAILSWDEGGGPTYGRAFVALLAGKLVGLVVLVLIAQAAAGENDGLGWAALPLTSLGYVPVGSLGLVASVWILMSAPRPEGIDVPRSGGTPWEYKLPPGAQWRE